MALFDISTRISHDLGLAAWFGGAWMGSYAMNAATREVDDHTQRTRVANAGWFRWAPVVALAIPAHVLGAMGQGRFDARWGLLRWVRAIATAGAVVATIDTGRSGRRVVAAGDVPVASAVHPISETPPEVARFQARLRVVQWLVPAFTGTLWLIEAWQQTHQRPRRVWRR